MSSASVWKDAAGFAAYIRERIAIRARRTHHPHEPERWTTDAVLRTYKFCNARRAWDRTSTWLNAHWYQPYFMHTQVGPAAALARFICHVPSLEAIGFPTSWSPASIKRILHQRKQRGDQVFTGAYIIRGGGTAKGASKIDTVVDLYLGHVHDGPLLRPWNSARLLYDALRTQSGWGAFMTQEVIQDLFMTRVLHQATDRDTFAVAGPGALRGLRWVMGDTITRRRDGADVRRFSESDASDAMLDLWHLLKERRRPDHPLHIPHVLRATMTVHDIEFNLCEYDKYQRTVTGRGNPPRSKYTFTDRSQLPLEL